MAGSARTGKVQIQDYEVGDSTVYTACKVHACLVSMLRHADNLLQPYSNCNENKPMLPAVQGELFLSQLDGVVSQLRADLPDCKLERRGLALLLAQLMQFMEDALGKEVSTCDCPQLTAHRHALLSMEVNSCMHCCSCCMDDEHS